MIRNQLQQCYTDDWRNKMVVAVFGLIIYGIGIPLGFFFVIWRHRRVLDDPVFDKQEGALFFYPSHGFDNGVLEGAAIAKASIQLFQIIDDRENACSHDDLRARLRPEHLPRAECHLPAEAAAS